MGTDDRIDATATDIGGKAKELKEMFMNLYPEG